MKASVIDDLRMLFSVPGSISPKTEDISAVTLIYKHLLQK